ncbi:MAG: 4Fe-4S binding protein [bacterium]
MMESECILCGGCADVCPIGCIEIIPFARLKFSEISRMRIDDINPFDPCLPLDRRMVLIKDEQRCIRCGLCAKQCPVGVMTMN